MWMTTGHDAPSVAGTSAARHTKLSWWTAKWTSIAQCQESWRSEESCSLVGMNTVNMTDFFRGVKFDYYKKRCVCCKIHTLRSFIAQILKLCMWIDERLGYKLGWSVIWSDLFSSGLRLIEMMEIWGPGLAQQNRMQGGFNKTWIFQKFYGGQGVKLKWHGPDTWLVKTWF